MNTPPPVTEPNDPRRRLRELLSIPERDRTEEQWDEINELEIQMAPGNRAGMTGLPSGGKSGSSSSAGGNPQQQPRKHRAKPNNSNPNSSNPNATRRPNRPNKPNKPPRDPA